MSKRLPSPFFPFLQASPTSCYISLRNFIRNEAAFNEDKAGREPPATPHPNFG